MTDKRASIFDEANDGLDLSGFAPKESKVEINRDEVKTIAEKNGFTSREGSKQVPTVPETLPPAPAAPMRIKIARPDQLSSKIQRRHYELFYAIVNETGWKNAEVIERAIEALAEKEGIQSNNMAN